MQTCNMTLAEWAQIEDNPRQRNTEERAKKARHLETRIEDQEVVKMAVLPGGRRIKIDGHTRLFFWQHLRPDLAPAMLLVIAYRARDFTHVCALYDANDSAAALETSDDKVFGSYRENEFAPTSPFLQRCRITTGMKLAYGHATHINWAEIAALGVHEITRFWLPELRLIDELRPNPNYFGSPVMAAALMTLRKYAIDFSAQHRPGQKSLMGRPTRDWASDVLDFWDRYNRNLGDKDGKEIDPVEALRRLVDQTREGQNKRATRDFMLARAVACVERSLAYKKYVSGNNGGVTVKGVDLSSYLALKKPDKPTPSAAPDLRKTSHSNVLHAR